MAKDSKIAEKPARNAMPTQTEIKALNLRSIRTLRVTAEDDPSLNLIVVDAYAFNNDSKLI